MKESKQNKSKDALWLKKPKDMPTEWRVIDGRVMARLVSRTPYCNVEVTLQGPDDKPALGPDFVEEVTVESGKDEEFMAQLRAAFGPLEIA